MEIAPSESAGRVHQRKVDAEEEEIKSKRSTSRTKEKKPVNGKSTHACEINFVWSRRLTLHWIAEDEKITMDSNTLKIRMLIKKRVAFLRVLLTKESELSKKEKIAESIKYLVEQKDRLSDMSTDEQKQLALKIIQGSQGKGSGGKQVEASGKQVEVSRKPVKITATSPRNAALSSQKAAPTIRVETTETKPEAKRADLGPNPAGLMDSAETREPEESQSNDRAPPEEIVPPVAPTSPVHHDPPTKPSARSRHRRVAKKTDAASVCSSRVNRPKVKRSNSYKNLDELDSLLVGENVKGKDPAVLAWSAAEPHRMSDWKIVVENAQASTKVTYHVHKLVMSTGPTKSETFERRFKEYHSEEDNTSEVTLSKSAAAAFPQLLDFMYSREDELDLNATNALGLRHLGKRFGIRKLVVLVTKFLREDSIPPMCLHYLNAAAEFKDQVVMARAAVVCAGSIMDVDREGLTNLDPHLFCTVISLENTACTSDELSKLVGEFCRKNEKVLTKNMLHVLTAGDKLPTIDNSEAVYLLSLSEKHETDDATRTNLEERCVLSGSNAWKSAVFTTLQEEELTGPYINLSAELKTELLENSLMRAQADYQACEESHEKAMLETHLRMEANETDTAEALKAMAEEIEDIEGLCARLEREVKRREAKGNSILAFGF